MNRNDRTAATHSRARRGGLRRLAVGVATAAVGLVIAAPAASAAPLQSDVENAINQAIASAPTQQDVENSISQTITDVRNQADQAFPGAIPEDFDPISEINRHLPEGSSLPAQGGQAAAQPEDVAPQEPQAPAVDTGPCPATARACVDIQGKRTWLQEGGNVSYGPIPMAPGAAGNDTPTGDFQVTRKVRDEISYEFNNAPMPYAVYFTNHGHAFHQGGLGTLSAGCVRLNQADAIVYFDQLQIGDEVFIY